MNSDKPTVKISASSLENVRASFGRALIKGDLIGRFYEIFLASNTKIAPMFKNTDFKKQHDLLRRGINLIIMYAGEKPTGKSGLARIAESHDHHHMNIEPKMYSYWERSFIEAVSEFDTEFDKDLKSDWEKVIRTGTQFITSKY